MFDFALAHDLAGGACATPGPTSTSIERDVQPVELGQAEILEWETDGMLLACGAMVGTCLRVAERLRELYGLRVGVVNARFVKPLDRDDDRQGHRGVRLRPDGRGGLPDGRLRLGRARGGQRRRAPHRRTSAGSACPTATSSTPSATSSSPRSAWTSRASPGRPWTWPGPSGCSIPELRQGEGRATVRLARPGPSVAVLAGQAGGQRLVHRQGLRSRSHRGRRTDLDGPDRPHRTRRTPAPDRDARTARTVPARRRGRSG